ETGRLGDGVVARVGAAEADAGDRDGLRRPDVLRREGRGVAGAVDTDRVAADDADEGRAAEVDRRRGRAVVRLRIRGGPGDGEVLRGDVRGQPAGLAEGVVAGVGAGERDAGDGDGLGGAGGRAREARRVAGAVHRDGVAGDDADERRAGEVDR